MLSQKDLDFLKNETKQLTENQAKYKEILDRNGKKKDSDFYVFMSEYGGDMDGSLGYMINVPEDLSDTDNSVTYSLRQNEGIPDEYISLLDFGYEDYLLYNLVDDSVVFLPDGNIECLNNKTLSKKWDNFNSFLEDFLGQNTSQILITSRDNGLTPFPVNPLTSRQCTIMEARDKFSTKENFATLIRLQTEFIDDCKKDIQDLKDSEDKGIQLYSLPNKEVIQNKHETILMYEYDNLLATYSMGESIDKILPLYKEIVSLMPIAWNKDNGYILMVNMLSIGILLGVEDTIFCQLAMVSQKEKLNDFLINYFLHYTCKIDVSVNSVNFLFSRPYAATKEVISFADKDKTLSVDRLKKYLSQEWYRGHSGCGWHKMHKIDIPVHSG